ncbi:MAG: 4Fe-4S binding protein [Peptococcaceae bacterium]|nr:4Fe-4S binding protein [Peptococcaceae bacterium]
MRVSIPFFIGILVSTILYLSVGWWGFLVIFPWIGFSISLGIYIMSVVPRKKKSIGRKVTIVMILPVLLFFVPIANNENFQLEGVFLNVMIGYFTKSFIHYAVAKIFGPVIWGRGFCGWACWTAAVLDWLPIKNEGRIPPHLKRIRYIAFALSIALPVALVFFWGFDVRRDYLHKTEMMWMFAGNLIYYLVAVSLAFIFKNKRAFCKIACPVAVVMKVPSSVSLITISPSGKKCLGCSLCNKSCPMDVDVMSYISRGKRVRDTECVLCMDCKLACPAGAIK